MTVRLFTTWYEATPADRRREYVRCLQQNMNCKYIEKILILDESSDASLLNDRLVVRSIARRPTFSDFFAWINELAGESDISIIANTDIALDDNVRMFSKFSWPEKAVMALSRWDMLRNGTSRLFERADSQDCWIFRGKIEGVTGDYPLGVYDCDNKIAWELQEAGYRVINPSLSLRTYHHHQSGFRAYERAPAPDYGIRPPFLYVEPDNLWGPLKAWSVKRELNLDYLPWQLTAKRFWRYPLPALMQRAWNKGLRVLGINRR